MAKRRCRKENWIVDVRAFVDNKYAVSESQAIQLTKKKLTDSGVDFKKLAENGVNLEIKLWDVEEINSRGGNLNHLSRKFKF